MGFESEYMQCNAMLLVQYHLTGPFSCKDYFVWVLNQLYAYLLYHLLQPIQKFCARFVMMVVLDL